jgi:hypothetical protein
MADATQTPNAIMHSIIWDEPNLVLVTFVNAELHLGLGRVGSNIYFNYCQKTVSVKPILQYFHFILFGGTCMS